MSGRQRQEERQDPEFLMGQAKTLVFKRKIIHQALVDNPDGRRQAANSHQAPFAVIAKGGNGAEQHQDKVLVFLEPHAWDMKAPTEPGQDGFMRARPEKTERMCRNKKGKWRQLYCFAKQAQKVPCYTYLGTYEIATDIDGSQLVGEFDDFVPYEPTSSAGKQLIRCLERKGCSNQEALEWLQDPQNWRSTHIQFVDFDCDLFLAIKAMQELRVARRA